MKNTYRIHERIIEGKTTGDDFEATAERLGKRRAHADKNPDAKPGEPGYERIKKSTKQGRSRTKRVLNKVLNRGFRKEVVKNNKIRRDRQAQFDADFDGPDGARVHDAETWEDAERQHREKQDFATSIGDTSYLNPTGLTKNIKSRMIQAAKRGGKSVKKT
tara:strand:+ start:3149 stop:3631 length:483 start_codon:yes stop_codon:yes gene_type:complete